MKNIFEQKMGNQIEEILFSILNWEEPSKVKEIESFLETKEGYGQVNCFICHWIGFLSQNDIEIEKSLFKEIESKEGLVFFYINEYFLNLLLTTHLNSFFSNNVLVFIKEHVERQKSKILLACQEYENKL